MRRIFVFLFALAGCFAMMSCAKEEPVEATTHVGCGCCHKCTANRNTPVCECCSECGNRQHIEP